VPLVFNVFVNDLCNVVHAPIVFFFFADDIKFFRVIKTPHDCSLLQTGIDCIYGWCTSNHMKINVVKLDLFLLLRKLI
jgi:hypothetical protein